MTESRIRQASFAAGEISPRLHYRDDLASHAIGCKTLRNMVVIPQGGVDRCPGTWWLGDTRQNETARIVPFVFSATDAFFLFFTSRKMRVYTRDGAVLDGPDAIYEVDTPYTEDDLEKLRWVQSADVMFLFADGKRSKELQRFGATDWRLVDAAFKNGPDRVKTRWV